MTDLNRALGEISAIRRQIAAATAFQGYGPAAIAGTGGLALVTTLAQAAGIDGLSDDPVGLLAGWVVTAALAAGLVLAEMTARSRRHHSGLADAMIHNAIAQFVPPGAAGALIGLVLVAKAPDALWILPGLWQVLAGLGLFASLRFLPGGVAIVAGWYVLTGIGVLALASGDRILSPWTMGLPFVIGQLLLAAILRLASGGHDADA